MIIQETPRALPRERRACATPGLHRRAAASLSFLSSLLFSSPLFSSHFFMLSLSTYGNDPFAPATRFGRCSSCWVQMQTFPLSLNDTELLTATFCLNQRQLFGKLIYFILWDGREHILNSALRI